MNLLREEETCRAVKGKNRSMEEQMKKKLFKEKFRSMILNKPQI